MAKHGKVLVFDIDVPGANTLKESDPEEVVEFVCVISKPIR